MPFPRALRATAAAIALLTVVVGSQSCGPDGGDSSADPATLRLGVLPDEDPVTLHDRYDPLVAYLANATGRAVELVVPDSYQGLLDLFGAGELELAYFGGVTFVRALEMYGAVPLVTREIDTRFTTKFVTRPSETAEGLADLRNRRLGFGSPLSTSGHYMPRLFLEQQGIQAEEFFDEVIHFPTHDRTALAVRDGAVDVGAVNGAILDRLFRRGVLDRTEVRVLWETPPYSDYIFATSPTLTTSVTMDLRNAFLSLSARNPEHAEVLEGLSTRLFVPAARADYSDLASVVNARFAELR